MKIFILFIIAGIIAFSCNGPTNNKQQEEVKSPETVFKSTYPDVTDVTWEQEGEFTEAEFEQNGIEISVLYDKDGNVLETETEIEISQLPESATTYITENYPGAEIEGAEKIESQEGNFFEVEIENENDEEMELLFDTSGNFKEIVTETDDEGEEDDNEGEEGNEVEIEISELPAGVTDYIIQNYPDYTITEAEKETIEEAVFFEVNLKNADGMEIDLVFDQKGNFIEKEVEE